MSTRNRVLAVDDNPTNLAIIDESLGCKFMVRLAPSGREALDIAPTFLPDVVLLDAMMPRPDGFEVCSQMKNDPILRHSQIIMVSAGPPSTIACAATEPAPTTTSASRSMRTSLSPRYPRR